MFQLLIDCMEGTSQRTGRRCVESVEPTACVEVRDVTRKMNVMSLYPRAVALGENLVCFWGSFYRGFFTENSQPSHEKPLVAVPPRAFRSRSKVLHRQMAPGGNDVRSRVNKRRGSL